jgi:hypothetical protein
MVGLNLWSKNRAESGQNGVFIFIFILVFASGVAGQGVGSKIGIDAKTIPSAQIRIDGPERLYRDPRWAGSFRKVIG